MGPNVEAINVRLSHLKNVRADLLRKVVALASLRKQVVVESLEQTAAGLRFKSPKSGRTVALSETVVEELQLRPSGSSAPSSFPTTSRLPTPTARSSSRSMFRSSGPDRSPRRPVRLRFHDLRHAHATHLLANGVHPKVASERPGHSKVGITLDLYSHVIPGMPEDAVATVDAALKTALRNRAETHGSNPVAGRIGGTRRE